MRSACQNHLLLHTIHFLAGLNENFATVKSQILLMEPLPPLNKVFSMILQHEKQGNFASSDDSNALINAARSRFATPSKSPPKVCTFCGRDNHTVDNCFKKWFASSSS
jgi:hypothetical protein